MIPLMVAGILLLWMYSYKPFRMPHRGGGELLQVTGTGVLLLILGCYAQAGSMNSFSWSIVLVIAPTSFACAIATALPDAPAESSPVHSAHSYV